ncbi:MAG: hypothetical protein GXP25_12850 [Planctomycetes bacterium]|nr:hypothetical protein [Planctomycetota bacterium]
MENDSQHPLSRDTAGCLGRLVLVALIFIGIAVGGGVLIVKTRLFTRVLPAACNPGRMWLSPDGKFVAYQWVERKDLPLPPEMPTVETKVYLRWCALAYPTKQQSLLMIDAGKKYRTVAAESLVNVVFSPDSKRMAVVTPERLMIVEVASDRRWDLDTPDQVITSLVWTGDDQVAYAAHSNPRGFAGDKTDRTLYLRKAQDLKGVGAITLYSATYDGGSFWGIERWSPRGRYVIFRNQRHGADLRLFDASTKTITAFGAQNSYTVGVSWKPDESAAVCVSQVIGGAGPCEALLLDPATGKTEDLTEHFAKAFGNDALDLPPLWTPDGRYVIVNTLKRGGCLVSPKPWKLVPVVELLLKKMGRANEQAGYIFPLLAKGWVRCWFSGTDYAVSYGGATSVTLGPADAPGAGWRMTPDGDAAVTVDRSGQILVRDFAVPTPKE